MKRLQAHIPALAIFCLALCVRIVYNLTVAQNYVPTFDAGFYQTIALHLLNQHCFCLVSNLPTNTRGPVWPFIIAGIYFLFGPQNLIVRLFLSVIGSATCVLVYLFARDLFGRRTGIVAGVVASVYTGLFIYDGWLYTESLYTFLQLAFCYTLYQLQTTGQQRYTILSGLSLGLMSLTRPNGVAFFALLIIWAFCVGRANILSWRQIRQSVLIITLLACLLIAPWTLRNYLSTRSLVLVSSGSGVVLAGAYNDTALTSKHDLGMWVPLEHISPPLNNCCAKGDAGNASYAKNWILHHLSAMPYLLSLHFINMWKPYTPEAGLPFVQFPDRLSSKIVWYLMLSMPFPIFALAALGLLVTWRRRAELLTIYLAILLIILQCLLFYGSSRFRAPIEPLLVVLASGVIPWIAHSKALAKLRSFSFGHKKIPHLDGGREEWLMYCQPIA